MAIGHPIDSKTETSLRRLFDEIVELPPDQRQQWISTLPLRDELRTDLRLMIAFDELIQHPPEQRSRELDALTLSAPERNRMQRMLAAYAEVPARLRAASTETLADFPETDELGHSLIGTDIGTFRLLELIGHGGSSVVFRAERAAGDGAQVVALKLLRTGLYSADAQRRFRREQAILAQLLHPNIAGLIEGGVSNAGIPYIAMELVEGMPITHAANARAMSIEQRLSLFCVLCRTMEAAHASLVVHRDLKPSNLLITRNGELKVLDFGIARLVDDEFATRTQSLAFTPEYAAPEQFNAGPLTTAVDIYALGVVLGELLTGQRLASNTRASTAIASKKYDGGQGVTPPGLPSQKELVRRLRGDLDSILAVALADEPGRRYRSANAFADDIERYVSARPVRAHPPSAWYRMRKFSARHRVAIGVTSILLLGMVGALGLAIWQDINARHSAAIAQVAAARADSMRDFMFNAFAEAEPTVARKGPVTVVEVVDRAIALAKTDRAIDPRARAELLSRLAEIIGTQGELARSGSLLEDAHAQSAQALGADDPLVWDIARLQAVNQMQRGEYLPAREIINGLIEHASAMPADLQSKVFLDSAAVARHVHDADRSLADARKAVAAARLTGNSDLLLGALDELGATLLSIRSLRETIDVYTEVLALDRARFGEQSSQAADALSGLSRAYRELDELDHSEEYAREALRIDKAIYPGDHWIIGNHLNALGTVLSRKRDFAGALEAFREALRISEATIGADHPETAVAMQSLAFAEIQLEDYASAIPHLRRALAGTEEKFGESSFQANFVRADYGYAIGMHGDYRGGAEAIEQALSGLRKLSNPDWDEIGRVAEKRIRIALVNNDARGALQRIDELADASGRVDEQASYWPGRPDCLRGEILLALGRASEAIAPISECGSALDHANKSEPVLFAAQPLLAAAAFQAVGDPTRARASAALGRKRLSECAYPPSRLNKLEATLLR